MFFFISLLSIITLLSSPVKWPCIKQSPLLSGYSHHLDFLIGVKRCCKFVKLVGLGGLPEHSF